MSKKTEQFYANGKQKYPFEKRCWWGHCRDKKKVGKYCSKHAKMAVEESRQRLKKRILNEMVVRQ